jgi:hypothetical protein
MDRDALRGPDFHYPLPKNRSATELLEEFPVPTLAVDPEGRIRFHNPGALRLAPGQSDLRGWHLDDLLSTEEGSPAGAALVGTDGEGKGARDRIRVHLRAEGTRVHYARRIVQNRSGERIGTLLYLAPEAMVPGITHRLWRAIGLRGGSCGDCLDDFHNLLRAFNNALDRLKRGKPAAGPTPEERSGEAEARQREGHRSEEIARLERDIRRLAKPLLPRQDEDGIVLVAVEHLTPYIAGLEDPSLEQIPARALEVLQPCHLPDVTEMVTLS